jgi:hypothetical protein
MFGVNVVKRTTIKNRARIRNTNASGNSQRVSAYRRGAMDRQIAAMAALREWAFEGKEP